MYITIEKVRSMCNKLGPQQVSDSEVEDFINKACARIDPVLSTRYRLPLPSPAPGLVESIAQDFAASFVLDKYYPGASSKEQIPLSKVYFDRAESDLKRVIQLGLIDNIAGVTLVVPPDQMAKPCMKSTTHRKGRSMIEDAMGKF